jgi:hypothetical protein
MLLVRRTLVNSRRFEKCFSILRLVRVGAPQSIVIIFKINALIIIDGNSPPFG